MVEEAVKVEEIDIPKKKILYKIVKRMFDLLVGILGTLIMLPIALIIKISYIFSGDLNSIFYSQKRVGKNGKEFKLYKFRTMVPDADKKLKELLKNPKYKKEWE